ncbi:hypothetical protein N7509_007226 [Penicillium cosmopolitanum]|uniref:Uncharacterized protein n=1 Tax=Penicillium cosmopolitanum TaxID=1131564 RepID=A0A9W9VYQ7_9EURO|nr:uncharacterized protein N7509_007226 [Penicillium cosmopolitanum]KAJ5391736.1 hypothetical protein N7509_007226 [Penicillium cosmopolitanum]
MPPHTWPARPDDQTRHPRFDDRWIRGLENMTDANLEHALLMKLGIATRNNEEGDLWHYHFCGFRQNLLPRYQRRFAAVTRRVAAWMNLPTTQALIRPKLEIFCALPPGAALVAGNWDGPVGREPDATTGAILDSCYDCLQCMQDYGLLPGGVTGELEYNDVGFALISVALCQMGRTKATDETELPDAQSVVDFFARRVTAPGVLPFVPYTLGGGAGISSIFQLALDQESWAPAIESLANWHQRTATARPCPVVFTELGFRARWQLCKVANLRVLQWARRHAVEISFGENPPTVPAMRHTVETCWQAVAHNPEGHLILDELLKTSPVQPNHICGTTGRNGISEAILCGRPNIVQWFLDQDRSNYEQNISERVVAFQPVCLTNSHVR